MGLVPIRPPKVNVNEFKKSSRINGKRQSGLFGKKANRVMG